MRESPGAVRAFEDYWALGENRSLNKLWLQYKSWQIDDTKPTPPTVRDRTLKEWSTQHHWQDRVRDRVAEECEIVRLQLQEGAIQIRASLAAAIQTDFFRFLQKTVDNKTGTLTKTASDLALLVRLYFQIIELPLAERQEVGGIGGGPIMADISDNTGAAFFEEAVGNPDAIKVLADFAATFASEEAD